ncbi:ataxin-10 [Macrobrachium rosenbergii]|uniref:ataxin-10 n=1 Tax=Macrobrachium rosenbergii TaxID=79674 RepID=UPI0034D48950
MSSDPQIILELSKEALAQHNLASLEECITKLELIREKLSNIDRNKLDSEIIWNLCGIINSEISKWTEECLPSSNSLEVPTQALFCLRNTFVNCSSVQLMVAETDELRNVVLAIIKWVFLSKHGRLKEVCDLEESQQSGNSSGLSELAKASITCLGNLVAANTSTRRIMWPYLLPLLRSLLQYHEETISYLACMVIFNCLLEEDLKKKLCSCSDVDNIICDMLSLYMGGECSSEKTSCFVLYNLELMLCCDSRVSGVWNLLSVNQQMLLLDILSNIVEGKSGSKCGSLPPLSVNFLTTMFKNRADKILRTYTNDSEDDSAMVVTKLLSFICLLGASEYWGPTLKEDKSLLITTVSLLQCMNEIGNVEGNEFSRMSLDDLADEQKAKAENHPAYGFKRDLIRLIASLVYRHKANQDQVRDMGGITLILESSQFDARNPGIKEVSIYAIRNLLEDNLENQEVVKNLEYKGDAESQGMQLTCANGMVVVHKANSSGNDESNQ